MDQIYYGRPEQYLTNISLFRFGGVLSNERSLFTTWAWIGSSDSNIYDDGSPDNELLDNQTFKIGQYAKIACKSAINYDVEYYLSSIEPTSDNDKCYGTAGIYGISSTISITTCVIQNRIFYPPMAFRLDNTISNSLCSSLPNLCYFCSENITNIDNYNECINTEQCDGPDRIGSGYVQCDSSEPGASDDVPYSFECMLTNITQINTAYPTPTPTDAPTDAPITVNPTLAPYTPGTPSRAPITISPTQVPSNGPTEITSYPSTQPTSSSVIPTNNPTIEPTNNPITTTQTENSQGIEPTNTDEEDDNDDKPWFKIFNFEIGLVELIIFLIILFICYCVCLLVWLLKNRKENKSEAESEKEDSEIINYDNGDEQYANRKFEQGPQYQSTRHSIHGNQPDGIELESQYGGHNTTDKMSYNV